MTLEEFAQTKLSARAKNVVMSINATGIRFMKDNIAFQMRPMLDANIFDVFKHLSKTYLSTSVANCGRVTAEEIAIALREEGFELKETSWRSVNDTRR